ncbi:MAG: hypothetical protein K8F30_00055 [Taibaiella sp.]|nr:hypothetical protein [Taibaiella sp.]
MSKKSAELREAIGNFIKATVGITVLQGEVKAVDETRWTCDVELPNTLLLYDVQLKCLKETEKGCVLVPKVGTWVQLLNLGEPDWLVIAMEDVDKVIVLADTELRIDAAGSTVLVNKDGIDVQGDVIKAKGNVITADAGGSTVKMDKNGIVMNGGKKGGLINIARLVELVNRVEIEMNDLKEKIAVWAISPNDGGAALKIALAGQPTTGALPGTWAFNTITQTTRSDIEDNKVKH